MAILTTFIDKQTTSRAGDALSGVTVGTLSHSLPATNPDMFISQLRSVAGLGISPVVVPLCVAANASILTIGYATTVSTASAPTILYDTFAIVFYGTIR